MYRKRSNNGIEYTATVSTTQGIYIWYSIYLNAVNLVREGESASDIRREREMESKFDSLSLSGQSELYSPHIYPKAMKRSEIMLEKENDSNRETEKEKNQFEIISCLNFIYSQCIAMSYSCVCVCVCVSSWICPSILLFLLRRRQTSTNIIHSRYFFLYFSTFAHSFTHSLDPICR